MDYATAVFRLLAIGVVVWVVAKVLLCLLRHAGVVPYQPFASREEYLEAALEMDLDLFIERAKATPSSVKWKKLETTPLLFAQPNNKNLILDTTLSTGPLSILGLPSEGLKFASGTTFVGQGGGNSTLRKNGASGAFRFKVGQWVRVTGPCGTGALAIIEKFGPFVHLRSLECRWSVTEDEIELAKPRAGEWWGWKEPIVPDLACFRISEGMARDYPREYLEQGWVVPVNFGIGKGKEKEKKSGVA